MSYCNCKGFNIRISTDEKGEMTINNEIINFYYIRCNICSGKWGYVNLENGNIKRFNNLKYDQHLHQIRFKPTRYISKGIRYEVLKRQEWRCNNCGKHLKYSKYHKFGEDVAHIDHIHPYSDWETYNGNINELSNLQALCGECNSKKYNRKD